MAERSFSKGSKIGHQSAAQRFFKRSNELLFLQRHRLVTSPELLTDRSQLVCCLDLFERLFIVTIFFVIIARCMKML
jgi:hypothetical protein